MSKNELQSNDIPRRNLCREELDLIFQEEHDRFVAEFSETVGNSPIGKLLTIIGNMPAIREEKVSDIRRQISDESYDLDKRLDSAMERVFEEYLI